MRLTALALAAAIPLSGCTTTGGVTDPGTITNVQNAAMAACSFLPTAVVIAQILGQHQPGLVTAAQVAQAICAAVTAPKPEARTFIAPTPTVAGVAIVGRFIK